MRRLCRYRRAGCAGACRGRLLASRTARKTGCGAQSGSSPAFRWPREYIPLIALISLWAHFPKLGAWLLLSLAVPLAIGGYSHFLSPGSDNVFRMAGGELTFAFRISAVLLFLLEFLGCWLGIQILRASSSSVASA